MAQINCNVYVFSYHLMAFSLHKRWKLVKVSAVLANQQFYKLHELTEPACKSAYLPTPQNIIGPTFKQDVGGI